MFISASTSQRLVTTGTGSPEGVLTRTVGSLYLQSDAASVATAFWAKMSGSGNTGWQNLPVADVTQMMLEVAGIRALALSRAPLVSPVFKNIPKVPTASPGTNTEQAASTAFVTAALSGASVSGDSDQIILGSQIFGA